MIPVNVAKCPHCNYPLLQVPTNREQCENCLKYFWVIKLPSTSISMIITEKEKGNIKLSFLEYYLKKYFDDMLIRDIDKIIENNKDSKFTLPYILLVCAGIDFLGGLTEGFKDNNSNPRSRNFIKDWMSKADSIYREEEIGIIIYSLVRCGSSHQSIYKKGIEISSEPHLYDQHISLRTIKNSKDRIFMHALHFVDDFKKAQNSYRKEYISENIIDVYKHLTNMLKKDEKKDKFNNLAKFLYGMNRLFDAAEPTHQFYMS